jgi:hypothetical protein
VLDLFIFSLHYFYWTQIRIQDALKGDPNVDRRQNSCRCHVYASALVRISVAELDAVAALF